MTGFRLREHGSSILVAALSTAFGVALLQATGYLGALFGDVDMEIVQTSLTVVALVFIGLALYTGAVVTTNTFGTIVAGRTRQIALLRLIGADARSLRRGVAREGAIAGLAGAAIGTIAGVGIAAGLLAIGRATGAMPDAEYPLLTALVWLPGVAVIGTTWAASRTGSRRVLAVTPAQATARAGEPTREELRRRPVRTVFSWILLLGGLGLIALGVVVGLVSPAGMLIAFFGGIGSFTGIVLGAYAIMPAVLRLVGRMFGRSAPARLAAANAIRYPERSTRTTIGMVIGVTLVTTFAVAGTTFQAILLSTVDSEEERILIEQAFGVTFAVLYGLVGFSAVIAAVGMVNNLSLSVLQRTRELGLLRALGLTSRQVRSMILAESAQMSIAAIGFGLLLGTFYGWAGAQSLLGSLPMADGGGLVVPVLPWPFAVGIAGGAALLSVVAALTPSRRATRTTPMRALAVV